MSTPVTERWFASGGWYHARTVLFCLPHAGGGAAAFRGWARALAPDVETLVVQLPGRERRIAEPAVIDPHAVAAAVRLAIEARGTPAYAFYGHSFGAWLAFEVIRELRRLGAPPPIRLYVGATRPPDAGLAAALRGLSTAPDTELAARLARLGGMPAGVFAEDELRDLVLPALRADFTWLDNYAYQPEQPLAVPPLKWRAGLVSRLPECGCATCRAATFSCRTNATS